VTGWLDDGVAEWHGRAVVRKAVDVAPRHRAVLQGVVRRVASRAAAGPHGRGAGSGAFDAWLDDGTGEVLVRWVGRARVPGVVPGVSLCVEGTVGEADRVPVILNPLYRFDADSSTPAVSDGSSTSTSW
jgi:hypothetical protein